MTFSDRFLDDVRARNDIVDVISRYTSLNKRGSNYVGLCPFHNEKTPSFSVSRDRQFYHCFGCGVGGDVIKFIMTIENLDFKDAVTHLATLAGMSLPAEDEGASLARKRRERVLDLNTAAARFFHSMLHTESGREALAYLNSRALSSQTQTRFGLGFAPNSWDGLIKAMTAQGFSKNEMIDAGLAVTGKNGSVYDRFRNRVMFPIIDVRGAVVGFGGRVMDDSKPKYLNSSETSVFNKRRNLFAMNLAKKSAADAIILAEGYMDVIALHQAGFDSAVASLGTSLTEEQVKLISNYKKEVVIAYDSDGAGTAAADRAIELLKPAGIAVRVLRLEGAKDPDEYIKKFGRERFARVLESSEADSEYKLSKIKKNFAIDTDEGRVAYIRAAAEALSKLESRVEREVYIARVANETGVSADAIKHEVERAYKNVKRRAQREETARNLAPISAHAPKSRAHRFDNPKSAIAEETIIATLCMRADWIDAASEQISAEEFSSPLLAEIYGKILEIHADEREVCASCVLSEVSNEASEHFSGVLARANAPSAEGLRDCIKVVKNEAAKQGENALARAAELYRDKKSYGG